MFKKVKVYARVLETRVPPLLEPQVQEDQGGFRPARRTLDSREYLTVHGSLPKFTCVFWTWRTNSTLREPCRGFFRSVGCLAHCYGSFGPSTTIVRAWLVF